MISTSQTTNKKNIAFKSIIIFRIAYALFLLICIILISIAIKADIEKAKLDTATDFSSRVQHLGTMIGHLETMTTGLSQAISYTSDLSQNNVSNSELDAFIQKKNVLTLKSDNYQSGLYSYHPTTKEQKSLLNTLASMSTFLPHFLYDENIENIGIYINSPQALLMYPKIKHFAENDFKNELKRSYWDQFLVQHENKSIVWRLVKPNDKLKLSLTVSILDPEYGLIGLIQLIFPFDVFDQEISQPSGPQSLLFLSEISPTPRLIASSKIERGNAVSRAFKMKEGDELPQKMQEILGSLNDWVYQSDDFYLLSVPISGAFNLAYLTQADSFSWTKSSLFNFGIFILVFLACMGVFVDKVIYQNLTTLKKKDDSLTQNNKMLKTTLKELKKVQQELIQKEKISSLGNVVAGLAHQVNTPLGVAITGVSYIKEIIGKLENKLETGIKKSELITLLKQENESVNLINSNLLKTARLVEHFKLLSGEESIDKITLFNVLDYTQIVVQGLEQRLEKKNIKLSIISTPEIQLSNYPEDYTQILIQLIDNAAIHGIEKNGNITIRINSTEDYEGVIIEVIDDGKGIEKELVDRVFEPFFTSKNSSEQMGLGLTIVHNLVLGKMSGKIMITSELGQGSTLTLYFPNLECSD